VRDLVVHCILLSFLFQQLTGHRTLSHMSSDRRQCFYLTNNHTTYGF